MATFPTSLPTFADPTSPGAGQYVWLDGSIRDAVDEPATILVSSDPALVHSTLTKKQSDEIAAIAAKVGIDSSAVTSSLDYLLKSTSSLSPGHKHSITEITGTKAEFDTAVTDGNFLYVGDVTQYTDEMAQDAVGAMVNTSLTYSDGTPLLALTSRNIGGVAYDGTADITVATATGGFTISGGDLAVGTNDITCDGTIIINPAFIDLSGTVRGLNATPTLTAASNSSAGLQGLSVQTTLAGAVNYTGVNYGLLSLNNITTSGTVSDAIGISGSIQNTGGGTITTAIAGDLSVINGTVAGTISNAKALQLGLQNNVAGSTITTGTGIDVLAPLNTSSTIGTMYGARIRNQGAAGITTSYGLYMEGQSGATTSYGLIVAGGDCGIGTTSPAARLHVFRSGTGANPINNRGVQIQQDFAETVASTNREVTGLYTIARITATNNQNNTSTIGLVSNLSDVRTVAGATGTITNMISFSATNITNAGDTIISNCYGLRIVSAVNSGGGSITKFAGIAIAGQTAATNNTHLLLGTTTAPTGNYGIYNSSTNTNYFAGYMGIGALPVTTQAVTTTIGTASDKGLVVTGAASQTGNLAEFQNSSGTPYLTIGAPVLSGGSTTNNYLNITGTFPSTLTAGTIGAKFDFTGAGSSAFNVNGMQINLLAGYTGGNVTACLNMVNSTAGTGATYSNNSYRVNLGNFGFIAQASATTAGINSGARGIATGSSVANYGMWGSATSDTNTPALNVGVTGFALSATTNCAGFFALADYGSSAPTFSNCALIADNGGTTGDIFIARDNGTAKVTISDGGVMTHTAAKIDAIRTVTAAGAVTVSAITDYVVEVNKTSGAATAVNLPASPATGLTFIIKDGKFDAATNNITITPAAGNIDGAATYVMNVNGQAVKIIYNGTQWLVI